MSVQTKDFKVANEYAKLCADASQAGAVVFFVGLVRDLYADSSTAIDKVEPGHVDSIELTHFSGMTERVCRDICRRAQSKFCFDAARVVHRMGKLNAGEQIVFVAVAGKHRKAVFAGAEFIMDYLKIEATIWKKEIGSRGSHWLGTKSQDKKAQTRWQQR